MKTTELASGSGDEVLTLSSNELRILVLADRLFDCVRPAPEDTPTDMPGPGGTGLSFQSNRIVLLVASTSRNWSAAFRH